MCGIGSDSTTATRKYNPTTSAVQLVHKTDNFEHLRSTAGAAGIMMM